MRQAIHETLVERLVADARPVRPLWPVGGRLALWLGLGVVVAAAASSHLGQRPDLAAQLRAPAYLLSLGVPLAAAILAAFLALRAAVPGGEARAAEWSVVALLGGATLAQIVLWSPVDPLAPADFVGGGLTCALRTVTIGVVPWLALLVALRRGASLRPATAGLLAGTAALLIGAIVLHTVCPADERWHVLTWHFAPIVPVAALSTALGWLALDRLRFVSAASVRARPRAPRPAPPDA